MHSLASTSQGRRRYNLTWESVQEEVLSRISSGQWRHGELIPTESELAKELGCARATVNRALSNLAQSGLLDRRRKVGTRVVQHNPLPGRLMRHVLRHQIEGEGKQYTYLVDQVSMAPVPSDLAKTMMLNPGDELLRCNAIFLADGQPYCCEERWISPEVVPELDESTLRRISAAEWMVSNVPISHANFAFSSTGAEADFVARTLQVSPGDPVLMVERVAWKNTLAVTAARQYFPSHHRFSAQL